MRTGGRHQVAVHLVDVDGDLADALRRICVEEDLPRAAQAQG